MHMLITMPHARQPLGKPTNCQTYGLMDSVFCIRISPLTEITSKSEISKGYCILIAISNKSGKNMSYLINKKTAGLLSLNDKCLEKIIGYLHFDECRKLVEAFDHKYRLDLIFRKMLTTGNWRVNSRMENFEGIVQNYGPQLTRVCVNTNNLELMNLLADFCIEGKLNCLEFHSLHNIDPVTITRSKTMLAQLKTLHMSSCEISDKNLGRLLAMCPQLETLSFEHMSTMGPLLEMTSTTIKAIRLFGFTNIDRSTLIQLLGKYPNLRRFECSEHNKVIFPHRDIICKMLPNLEQLSVDSHDICHVIDLKQLKKLHITLHIDHLAEVNNYLTMSTGIHSLTIRCKSQSGQQFDGLIEAICTCASIKELTLYGVPDVLKSVVKLAESLPLLRSFVLQASGSGIGDCDWQQSLWLEFVAKSKRLEMLWAIDNFGNYERERPNLTDFSEKLRSIVQRREQSHRRLRICLFLLYSFGCDYCGSHVSYNHTL